MNEKILPLIALKGLTIFPGMTVHFDVARDKSVQALIKSTDYDRLVVFNSQKDAQLEDVTENDIYQVGTVAKIKQITKLTNTVYRVVAQGIARASVNDFLPDKDCFICRISYAEEFNFDQSPYISALIKKVKALYLEYLDSTKNFKGENHILTISDPVLLSDIVSSGLTVDVPVLQEILSEFDVQKRLEKLVLILTEEIDILNCEKEIDENVKENIDKNQREYFIREKIKVLRERLDDGEGTQREIDTLTDKIKAIGLEKQYEEELLSQVNRLSYIGTVSQEYGVIKSHIETILKLPWNAEFSEFKSYTDSVKLLNESHYGMELVKEKILDNIATRIHNPDYNGAIICLVGPPGVGKTSIATSIAHAMGRKLAKVSLGGLKDESEIRGHRRTYVGAIPGRIINSFMQCGCKNPVFLLDEIDKLGSDFRGDPSSALLEVLDPEQNKSFVDNYLGIPFDLSKTIFIATANDISNIPMPLRDRLDIVELESYTENEKVQIAQQYLITKEAKKHNIKKLKISDTIIKKIINNYTKESGVRQLERYIATIYKKYIRATLSNQKFILNKDNLTELIGVPVFTNTINKSTNISGRVNGLAWTQFGGEMLHVEAVVLNGSGKNEITGNLGDVMKESAELALSVTRNIAKKYMIDTQFHKKCDIHIHFPEGAVPKDGPSAGITITTALISALTGRIPKSNIAMTGEISLSGNVLPIGGVKEKILAAIRNKITDVIIPFENKQNVEENISKGYISGINIHYVKNIHDVLEIALTKNIDKNNVYVKNSK